MKGNFILDGVRRGVGNSWDYLEVSIIHSNFYVDFYVDYGGIHIFVFDTKEQNSILSAEEYVILEEAIGALMGGRLE